MPGDHPNPVGTVACLACRNKHMKCDFLVPRCTRCREGGYDCTYLKSRRGFKGPRRTLQVGVIPLADDRIDYSALVRRTSLADASPSAALNNVPGRHPASTDTMLLKSYFEHFHPAHPIVLPRSVFPQRCRGPVFHALKAVMAYIGAVSGDIVDAPSLQLLFEGAERATQGPAIDVFGIQARVLFIVALHSKGEQHRSMELLRQTVDTALELGLNRKEFALSHGGGDICMEESLRRTWWELFVVDGMFSTVHEQTFRLWAIDYDVPIPCEELNYLRNKDIPPPMPLHEFDNRFFATEEIVFSSFAYRIDAMRVLGKVMLSAASQHAAFPGNVDDADTSLTRLALDLPKSKTTMIAMDDYTDEMLFQAHMIINASSIILHRPRSNLAYSAVPGETVCTNTVRYNVPARTAAIETTKVIDAANGITRLIKLPMPLLNHTPMFTCAITLAAIVHLSAYSLYRAKPESTVMRSRLELSIAALKQIREVWGVAGTVLLQVRQMSTEIFTALGPTPAPLNLDALASWHQHAAAHSTEAISPEQDVIAMLEDTDESWPEDFEPSALALMPAPELLQALPDPPPEQQLDLSDDMTTTRPRMLQHLPIEQLSAHWDPPSVLPLGASSYSDVAALSAVTVSPLPAFTFDNAAFTVNDDAWWWSVGSDSGMAGQFAMPQT